MIISVAKADGTLEEFDVQKLRQSLLQSGATQEEITPIVTEIESIIYEGMGTQEIYKHAFELLQGSEVTVAARYSLRRALFRRRDPPGRIGRECRGDHAMEQRSGGRSRESAKYD